MHYNVYFHLLMVRWVHHDGAFSGCHHNAGCHFSHWIVFLWDWFDRVCVHVRILHLLGEPSGKECGAN